MKNIESLVRPNIRALTPYSSARDDFKGADGIFLDANENPFGNLNRYPDPYQQTLKESLASLKQVAADFIFIGNGSDEVIDLACRIFCDPGKDKVIVCPPTYGMYEVSANINDLEVISIPLTEDFQLDVPAVLSVKAKLIFLCSPNNPTGNNLDHIEEIIREFEGIVFVDEAYIDFSSRESFLKKVTQYPNLIVAQTFSKGWGKAAIRVGVAYSNPGITAYFNKIKPPYNVSHINQVAAMEAIGETALFNTNRQVLIAQRSWMADQLSRLPVIEKVYPSEANFLLVKTRNADVVYQKLVNDKIIVRNRHTIIENCLRITVGQPQENIKLIESLKRIIL